MADAQALRVWRVPYDSPTVTTAQAKQWQTNENVAKDLTKMADHIMSLNNREDQVNKLKELTSTDFITDETCCFLHITSLREKQHFDFMEFVLSEKIPEWTENVQRSRNLHDYSKDHLFYFAAASYYDGDVKTKNMELLKDRELDRHYKLESHHPEYEKFNNIECNELDILEMSIDRLARNLQFGTGLVDLEVLYKFMPKFTKGDNDKKRALMWKYVEKYKTAVQDAFYEMFPDTKEWVKS